MAVDFQATGQLERADNPNSSPYQHVKGGSLRELVEHVIPRSTAQIHRYRITVGKTVYTGRHIMTLCDDPNFLLRKMRS